MHKSGGALGVQRLNSGKVLIQSQPKKAPHEHMAQPLVGPLWSQASGQRDTILGCQYAAKEVDFARFSGGISMHVLHLQSRRLILATVVCLACQLFVTASDEPTL